MVDNLFERARAGVTRGLIEQLFGCEGAKWTGDKFHTRSPLRPDKRINQTFTIWENGNFYDSATDEKGDLIDLISRARGYSKAQAAALIIGEPLEAVPATVSISDRPKAPRPAAPAQTVVSERKPTGEAYDMPSVYRYTDRAGRLVFAVYRKDGPEGKEIKQAFWVGEAWAYKQPENLKKDRPLYNLPRIRAGVEIVLVEGEKKADALNAWAEQHRKNYLAVTWSGGATATGKTDFSPLAGLTVTVWPDNDEPGLKCGDLLARSLSAAGARVRVVETATLGDGQDVFDVIEAGGDPAVFLDYAALFSLRPVPRKMDPKKWIPEHCHIDDKGKIKPQATLDNFRVLVEHYGIRLRENLMSHALETFIPQEISGLLATGEGKKENSQLATLRSLAVLNGFSTDNLDTFTVGLAHEKAYHPVKEWIESTSWDGESRIPRVCQLIREAPGFDAGVKNLLIEKWLLSAVACVFEPVYYGRGVLTLQGAQSQGKTSFFRNLVPCREWFSEGLQLDPKNKDTIENAISFWICELGELEGIFRRADIEQVKNFLTKSKDSVRFAYERRKEDYPRRSVYCATVNDERFLTDPTGSSRFWVIPCASITYKHDIDLAQLWAEVYAVYRRLKDNSQDAIWWLSPNEERLLSHINTRHELIDEVESLIRDRYDFEAPKADWPLRSITQISQDLYGTTKNVNKIAQSIARTKIFEREYDESRNYKYRVPRTKYTPPD